MPLLGHTSGVSPGTCQIQPWTHPQLAQTAPLHHQLPRAGGCWGAPAAHTAGLWLCQRGASQGTIPTGTLQGPGPLPVVPPWMDRQTEEERLLSRQQEHKKLVFNIPVANAELLLLLLTQGHRSILQTLIKSQETVVLLSIREMQGVLCLQQHPVCTRAWGRAAPCSPLPGQPGWLKDRCGH